MAILVAIPVVAKWHPILYLSFSINILVSLLRSFFFDIFVFLLLVLHLKLVYQRIGLFSYLKKKTKLFLEV